MMGNAKARSIPVLTPARAPPRRIEPALGQPVHPPGRIHVGKPPPAGRPPSPVYFPSKAPPTQQEGRIKTEQRLAAEARARAKTCPPSLPYKAAPLAKRAPPKLTANIRPMPILDLKSREEVINLAKDPGDAQIYKDQKIRGWRVLVNADTAHNSAKYFRTLPTRAKSRGAAVVEPRGKAVPKGKSLGSASSCSGDAPGSDADINVTNTGCFIILQ